MKLITRRGKRLQLRAVLKGAGLAVERAVGDLRRGLPVVMVPEKGQALVRNGGARACPPPWGLPLNARAGPQAQALQAFGICVSANDARNASLPVSLARFA